MSFYFNLSVVLAALVLIGAVVLEIRRYRQKGEKKQILSGIHILTIGVFLACFIIHLPFYYGKFDFLDTHRVIRPILLSIHSTLQAFVLGFNYKDLIDSMPLLNPNLNAVYTSFVAVLYVIAPILTLTNILYLFKDLKGELQIKLNRKKPLYFFSELNPQSIAMAQSIVERYRCRKAAYKNTKTGKRPPRPMLIFTDVFSKDEESDQEMLEEARRIGAICLKSDITHLNLPDRKCPMEFFLIGMNESENMEQTINLNEKCKGYPNRSVFVFSSKASAGYILDTMDKGELTISPQTKTAVRNNAKAFLSKEEDAEKNYQIENCYYIRRVDSINSLTVNTLTDRELLLPLIQQAKQTKTISVMLVGFGLYGEAFLKNALWLFQFCGYRLCINIIDTVDKDLIDKRIRKQMPEIAACLVSTEDPRFLRYYDDRDGDCQFDIRVCPSVNCDVSDLSDLFDEKSKEPANPAAFSGTQLVIVALGEDNKNIETAVELRRLFDRMNHVSEKAAKKAPDETPVICSVVYDDRTANNLNCSKDGKGLINYKGTPYHIRFIGQMAHHYSYTLIETMKLRENKAIWRHFEWIKTEEALRACYHSDPSAESDPETRKMLEEFRGEMQKYFKDSCGGKESWGDDYLYQDGKLVPEYVLDSILSYTDFEYYRNSSVARAIHQELLNKYFKEDFDALDRDHRHREIKVCSCEKCRNLRITEHMRWNAYMKVNGYIHSKTRSDRAKTHNDLVLFDELITPEKYKD